MIYRGLLPARAYCNRLERSQGHLLRPGQPHPTQTTDVDLGVEAGGVEAAMAEEISDGLERTPFIEQSCCPGMRHSWGKSRAACDVNGFTNVAGAGRAGATS